MTAMLTATDLRWMEAQRRRAALRRLLDQDDGALRAIGVRRREIEDLLDRPADGDPCAGERLRPAIARRLGCPG